MPREYNSTQVAIMLGYKSATALAGFRKVFPDLLPIARKTESGVASRIPENR